MTAPRRARTRVVGVPGDHPPALDLGLKQRLMGLALANIVPLLVGAIVWIGVAQGKWTLNTKANQGLVPLLMILGCAIVLTCSMWIVLPLGRWLRERPAWHYRRESKVLWMVPYAAGWCAWGLCWIVGVGSALASLALLGIALVRLWQAWMAP